MIKEALTGNVTPQIQGMQQPLPMFPQIPQQPMMLDPYGQQQSGLRQALMGRMFNAY